MHSAQRAAAWHTRLEGHSDAGTLLQVAGDIANAVSCLPPGEHLVVPTGFRTSAPEGQTKLPAETALLIVTRGPGADASEARGGDRLVDDGMDEDEDGGSVAGSSGGGDSASVGSAGSEAEYAGSVSTRDSGLSRHADHVPSTPRPSFYVTVCHTGSAVTGHVTAPPLNAAEDAEPRRRTAMTLASMNPEVRRALACTASRCYAARHTRRHLVKGLPQLLGALHSLTST